MLYVLFLLFNGVSIGATITGLMCLHLYPAPRPRSKPPPTTTHQPPALQLSPSFTVCVVTPFLLYCSSRLR